MSDWQMNQCAKEAHELSEHNDGIEVVVVYNESMRRYEAIAESAKEEWYGDAGIVFSTNTGWAI